MSLERGGRTDKEGNVYENRFLARLFLQLINEKLHYVQVEPVEEYSDSSEFIAVDWDGVKRYYQCKSSNKDYDHWRLSDMKSYKIFPHAKEIISADSKNQYVFISPLGYRGLDSLCERARTSSSPQDFVKYQLTQEYKSYFDKIAETLQLDPDISQDCAKLIGILSRCYFETYGRSREEKEDLEAQIGYMFFGAAETVRILLEQYANDNRQYGVKITAQDILKFLKSQNITLRDIPRDVRVLPQIQSLNSVRWGTFFPINGALLHRRATDQIIQAFEAGSSVILHGRAGAGKSGCVEEFIQYLRQKGIMYLAIKLDKEIPLKSADDYGRSLGLPQSPVHVLNAFAPEKPCVLILDQLDSLRWTSMHSATALDVCKEMIQQVKEINQEHGGKISTLLVSRTFDLETDPGLQSLFEDQQQEKGIKWSKVQIGLLTEDEVQGIVGDPYAQMPTRLKKTLQIPSSLLVWSRLEDSEKRNAATSSFQLMEEWWNQIKDYCAQMSLDDQNVCACKNKIVSFMDNRGQLTLPTALFSDNKNIIKAFASNGLLVVDHKRIAFAHQSFLDYFLAQKAIQNIYNGQNLADLYKSISQQIPSLRYRFLMILQTLLDSDTYIFVEQAKKILESNDIHYYFQCTVFEIIGQWEGEIEPAIFSLVKQYQTIPKWERFIFRTVFLGHPNYIYHYFDERKPDWLDTDGMQLLSSISDLAPDFVLSCVQPYAFRSQETDQKIISILCRDVEKDSDALFAFRLEMLKKYPREVYHSMLLFRPEHLPIKRLLALLKIVIDAEELWNSENIYFGNEKGRRDVVQKHHAKIVNSLFPHICSKTQKLTWPSPYHDTIWENRPWENHEYPHAAREIVEFVKMALEEYVSHRPQEAFDNIVCSTIEPSVVGQELVMHAASLLPYDFGTKVLRWLLEDFRKRIFVYTFDEKDYLCYAKKIVARFSKFCDDETLQELEETVCKWNDDPAYEKNVLNRRREVNHKGQYAPVYYAYWGHMQKELLPEIEGSRLSKNARELLEVVQRNEWIDVPFYHTGSWSGECRTVVSPISGKEECLSDRKWLEIISVPEGKMKCFWGRKNSRGGFVEASPSTFAASLQSCVKRQPTRFAKLALSFPENCFSGYISAVFYGLADPENAEMSIDSTLSCQLIQKYFRKTEDNIALGLLYFIDHAIEEDWPEEILSIAMWLARNHPNPQENTYVTRPVEDPENKTIDSIRNSALNCVRGKALLSMATIIQKHPEWLCKVQQTVEDAANDTNDSVRFALTHLTAMFYPQNPAFARNIFLKLLAKDIRIIDSRGFRYLIRQDFQNEPVYYQDLLITACQSELGDVAKCAAGQLCAVALFFNDTKLLDWLQNYSFSNQQIGQVCKQAVYYFQDIAYRELSEKIIRYCVQATTEKLTGLHQLFYNNCLDLQQDKEFVLFLMASNQGSELVHTFFEYLNASSLRGKEYALYLRAIVCVQKNNADWYFLDAPKFVDSVLRLLDDNQGEGEIVEMALDIWDRLYEKELSNIKQLSAMLNNLE